MRGFSKKILISLLTTLVVFITVFATTYAWVGIFTYAKSDSFKMNLKVQDLDSNYFLTISSSGRKDDFHSEVPVIEIKRQILNNRYNNSFVEQNDLSIDNAYNSMSISPVTAIVDVDNNISHFEQINLRSADFSMSDSKSFYKFDLYLSVDTKEGITDATTGIKANVIMTNLNETIQGTINNYLLINGNNFTELPSSPINDFLKQIPSRFKVDSKNATRFALEIYEPITITDEYTDELPLKTTIYQGGNDTPLYDEYNDVYDLGGCLPEEQNTSLQELYIVRPNYVGHIGNYIQNASSRQDLVISEENSYVWNKREHTSYLGCMNGIQTKMKVTVYFWFEGWDADCLKAIDMQNATLNLTFTSGTDD